jgi:hypothetical protein
VALALSLHALTLAPGAAGGDPPAGGKGVAERFHDHENKMATSIAAGNSVERLPAERKGRNRQGRALSLVRPSTGGLGGWDGRTRIHAATAGGFRRTFAQMVTRQSQRVWGNGPGRRFVCAACDRDRA